MEQCRIGVKFKGIKNTSQIEVWGDFETNTIVADTEVIRGQDIN